MPIKVAKFGGTSLADAAQIRKSVDIIRADPGRSFVVPSAPGKRSGIFSGGGGDRKITDLLYLCHEHVKQSVPFDEIFKIIADRYLQIASELKLKLNLAPLLESAKKEIARHTEPDFAASRGEFLMGQVLAELLGYEFIDAAKIVFFDEHGRFDPEKTQAAVSETLKKHPRAVVPGFYGSLPNGKVKTFSRGGSDISGAIVARGAHADVYENWTDVNGLLMADPRVIDHPKTMDVISYKELRELAYMGATVLHDEAIFPVRKAGIPVNIRNTNAPDHPGTLIVREAEPIRHPHGISGIAGRKDFTVIHVEKALMNAEVGFGRRLLSVFEDHAISYEHTPSGIDTMSVVVSDSQLNDKLDTVVAAIKSTCQPDSVVVHPHMALIATVGRGMAHTPGIASRLFTALFNAGVNIRMIDQGSSEINIIVGVETADFETAVRAIYHAFVK